MVGSRLVSGLLDGTVGVYALGLLAIVGVRAGTRSGVIRTAVLTVALSGMALTYAVDRWDAAGRQIARPGLLAVGLGGLAVGVALATVETLVGLAFLVGGLLFVNHAVGETA